MFHLIEFRWAVMVEIDQPESALRELVTIKEGTRLQVDVRPYVVESDEGPIEVADLCFKDGSIAHAVRFGAFRFLDQARRRTV